MKYDVFISYSRKDYIRDDAVIPDNPITAIIRMFDKNGISYWFDKEGIYSGEEFVREISSAIVASKMLVFISSEGSNVSEYTCGEILKAKKAKKLIIPFLIDECDYNEKFEILLLPLNHIDYVAHPNTALPELLRTVKKEKERIEKIEADSERMKRIEQTRKEIKEKAKEYLALAGQQDYILDNLYSKNKLIGNTIKRCPVCEKETSIQLLFCSQCGWQFPKLYGIDGGNASLYDEAQLAIARKCWQGFSSIPTLQKENEGLKMKFEKHLKGIARKDSLLTDVDREFVRIVQNGKFGFVNRQSGEIVISCKWTFAGSFQEGLAFVKDEYGKHGFIDMMGNIVISCKWNGAADFSEGLAAVRDENNKCGFIDRTGTEVIPCKWQSTWSFNDGLARVKDEYKKYGFIDKTGNLVIPCKWEYAKDFQAGLAKVSSLGKDGFIDKKGNIVVSY